MTSLSRRKALTVLATAPFLVADECSGPHEKSWKDGETEFRWRGRIWKFLWSKDLNGGYFGLVIMGPDGTRQNYEGDVYVKDGVPFPGLPGASPLDRVKEFQAATANAYVCVLDTATQDLVRLFDLSTASLLSSIPISSDPFGLAASPDGLSVFVSHPASTLPVALPPRVTVIDTLMRRLARTINLPARVAPGVPLFSPDGAVVYVPNQGQFVVPTGYTGASVVVLDPASGQITGEIPLNTPGQSINKMAITPDGTLLFAVLRQTFPARLFVIDTVNREIAATSVLPGSSDVRDMLMDTAGARLYFATNDSVVVYDTATVTPITTIPVLANGRLNRLALSLDGGSLFVNPDLRPFIFRIDTSTNKVAEQISFGTQNPDSSMIFVTP